MCWTRWTRRGPPPPSPDAGSDQPLTGDPAAAHDRHGPRRGTHRRRERGGVSDRPAALGQRRAVARRRREEPLCLAERTDDSGRAEIASAATAALPRIWTGRRTGFKTPQQRHYLFGPGQRPGRAGEHLAVRPDLQRGVRSFARAAAGAGIGCWG